jgi:DNA primase
VTAAYGVEGFTADHLAAFQAHGVARVLIAFDRDEAGDRGTVKVAETLQAEGIDCWRIQFPKGLDANAYALKVTPAGKSLGLLIRKAEWLGNGAPPSRAAAQAPEIASAPPEPAHLPLAAKEETVSSSPSEFLPAWPVPLVRSRTLRPR